MPPAARILDTTTHGGTIVGPGAPTVLIGSMPAAVAGDNHVCPMPWPGGVPHGPTPFPTGSGTVFIEGKPAVRTTDTTVCGAITAVGEPTVMIGG